MPTELHVTAAGFVVISCLGLGYGLFLAAEAVTRMAQLSAVSGYMGVM